MFSIIYFNIILANKNNYYGKSDCIGPRKPIRSVVAGVAVELSIFDVVWSSGLCVTPDRL